MTADHENDAPTSGAAAPKVRRKRNQRGEGERLRIEIIEAAGRLLDREPGVSLSLRMVAKEAGIAPPSIYAHFENRDTMVAEVIRVTWVQLAQDLTRAAHRARAKGPHEQLIAQVRAYIQFALESPSRYQLLFALPPSALDTEFRLRPAEPAHLEITQVLRRCQDAGYRIPMGDPGWAALVILSFMHGRIALGQTAPDRSWNTREAIEKFTIASISEMVSPPSARRPRTEDHDPTAGELFWG